MQDGRDLWRNLSNPYVVSWDASFVFVSPIDLRTSPSKFQKLRRRDCKYWCDSFTR